MCVYTCALVIVMFRRGSQYNTYTRRITARLRNASLFAGNTLRLNTRQTEMIFIFVLRHMSNVTLHWHFRSKQFRPTELKHNRQEICGVVSLTNTNQVHFVCIITIGTCTLLRLRQDILASDIHKSTS